MKLWSKIYKTAKMIGGGGGYVATNVKSKPTPLGYSDITAIYLLFKYNIHPTSLCDFRFPMPKPLGQKNKQNKTRFQHHLWLYKLVHHVVEETLFSFMVILTSAADF